MKIEKAYLIPHFHFDFEWWKEEPYHEQDTLLILDEALRMLETYPEFTYVIETILPLKTYMENREEGYERIKGFVDQGRIELVGGCLVAPDEVLPTGEALIRQFEEGQEWLSQVFGVRARVAWEVDEFAHPARMPQVLAPLGFTHFVFARGLKPFDSMHPTLFHWEDPAGKSKLTSYWWAGHYEGSLLGDIRNDAVRKKYLKRFFREMESRLAFEGERSPVPWLMIPLGGDFAIPHDIWVDFVKLWNESKEVKLEFSLPSRYFQLVEQFNIPEYTGRFPHVFDGYFTSREKGKQAGRKGAHALLELEKLNALAGVHGLESPGKDLKESWWEVLKGDFHDTLAGTGTDRVYRKTMARYRHAEELQLEARQLTLDALGSLLREHNYVFNSLNWERDGIVRSEGEETLVRARPLSLQALDPDSRPDEFIEISGTSIENSFLRLEIDKEKGSITVFDKKRNFSPIAGACNRTSIIDDAGNLWVSRSSGKKYPLRFRKFSIRKNSAYSATISLLEENRFVSICKEISLQVKSRQIDFKTDITFAGRDKRIDMEFPFSFEGEWLTENIFHTEKVGEGIYPVQNFSLYEGRDYSVALINRGIPGYLLESGKGSLMLMRSVSMFSITLIRWIVKNIPLIYRSLKHAYVYLRKKLNIIEFPVYPVHNLFLRSFASEGDLLGHGAMNPQSHRKARMRFPR